MSKEVYIDYLNHDNTSLIFNGQYDCVDRTKIKKDLEVLEILKKYFDDYQNKTKLLNTFEGTDEYELLEEWLEDA